MKIAIGSDKSGFALKQSIIAYLDENNIEYDNFGVMDMEHGVPYFEVASEVAPLVANKTYEKAILICGTGAGMGVVANKHRGVYAVPCENVYSAKMCRSINGANVLCMGGWIVGAEMGVEMVKAFLNTDFLEKLEPWRQEFLTNAAKQVANIEDNIYNK